MGKQATSNYCKHYDYFSNTNVPHSYQFNAQQEASNPRSPQATNARRRVSTSTKTSPVKGLSKQPSLRVDATIKTTLTMPSNAPIGRIQQKMISRLRDEYIDNLSLVYKMKIAYIHAESRSSRSSSGDTASDVASRSESLVEEFKRLKRHEKKWISSKASGPEQTKARFLYIFIQTNILVQL